MFSVWVDMLSKEIETKLSEISIAEDELSCVPSAPETSDIKPEYKTIASQLYTAGEADERELAVTLLQRRDLDLKGVRIKDGETLVIGGMIQEMETKTVSKIPFLGDLPVIGMFFRSTGTNKEKSEMVIMLTPQIVLDTEDAIADDNML